jgi:5'-nucleotidase / UDP-sugar diphosphatase
LKRDIIEKEETVETSLKVSTREYVIQKNDTLSKIAQKELGSGHRWKFLYELNKDVIRDPNKLKVGQTIIIPVE